MRKLAFWFIFLSFSQLTCDMVYAQTCVPQYCTAKWPPPKEEHSTEGKDNCNEVCIKMMASTTGYMVVFGPNAEYHRFVDADMAVVSPSYLILKKSGKEVARFDRKNVVGFKVNDEK